MKRDAKKKDSADLTAEMQPLLRAAHAASEKKGLEIVALDLRKATSFTDFFLVCSGNSQRQVQAIADNIEQHLREAGLRPTHTEGYSSAEWILLDYGNFIVHVFSASARRFYDLERLWRDAEMIELPDEARE